MTKYIAFLRAINVGGHRVKMDVLKSIFQNLEFTNVETFIASGNVIFDSISLNSQVLEKEIEQALKKELGYEVDTFVRTTKEVKRVAEFSLESLGFANIENINVGFLTTSLIQESKDALLKLKTNIDDFFVQDREVYWLCKTKQSESSFSNAVFERKLKVKTTFRAISTIKKLAEKYSID